MKNLLTFCFVWLLSAMALFGQGLAGVQRNPWTTNPPAASPGVAVQGLNNLMVTNVGSGTSWWFYAVRPETIARLLDVTNIIGAISAGTNALIQTNGVNVGSIGTLNFNAGVTGFVSGSVVTVGVSSAGGGGDQVWTNDNNSIRPADPFPLNFRITPSNSLDQPIIMMGGTGASNWWEIGFGGGADDYSLISVRRADEGDNRDNNFAFASAHGNDANHYAMFRGNIRTNSAEFTAETVDDNGFQGFSAGFNPAIGSYISLVTNNVEAFKVDKVGGISAMKGVVQNWPITQGANTSLLTNNGSGTLGWWVPTFGGDAGGTNARQFGTLVLTNLSGNPIPYTNILVADVGIQLGTNSGITYITNISAPFFTNWVNAVSNLVNTKQHGTATLTNLSGNPVPFTNIIAAADGIALGTNAGITYITNTASGGGTNTLWQTNGTSLGSAGTFNFTFGATGHLAGAVANVGIADTWITVAASNSQQKAFADFICDGVSDQATISNALWSLPDAGGTVLVLEGTYWIDGSIFVTNGQTLLGEGFGTQINIEDGFNADLNMLTMTNTVGARVAYIHFTGTNTQSILSSGNPQMGIMLSRATNCVVEGNWINHLGNTNVASCIAINPLNSTDIRIINNQIDDVVDGINTTAASSLCQRLHISGNIIKNISRDQGIFINNTLDSQVIGNIIMEIGGQGISLNNAHRTIVGFNVVSNTARNWTDTNFNKSAAILLSDLNETQPACSNNTIIGNSILSWTNTYYGIWVNKGGNNRLINNDVLCGSLIDILDEGTNTVIAGNNRTNTLGMYQLASGLQIPGFNGTSPGQVWTLTNATTGAGAWSNAPASVGGGGSLTVNTNGTAVGTETNINFTAGFGVGVMATNVSGTNIVYVHGNVIYTNFNFVQLNGNNATARTNDPNRPWSHIPSAIAAARRPGTAVIVGPGVFSMGSTPIRLSNNVHLIGAGRGVTIIEHNCDIATAGQGPGVQPGDNSLIAKMSIRIAAGAQDIVPGAAFGFGSLSTGTNATNFVVSDCDLSGNIDCVYFDLSGYLTNSVVQGRFFNCFLNTDWDAAVIFNGLPSSRVDFYNCHVLGDMSPTNAWDDGTAMTAYKTTGGSMGVYGGSIRLISSGTNTSGPYGIKCNYGPETAEYPWTNNIFVSGTSFEVMGTNAFDFAAGNTSAKIFVQHALPASRLAGTNIYFASSNIFLKTITSEWGVTNLWPTSQGLANSILVNNGSGVLTWSTNRIFSPTLSNATIKPLVVGVGNAAGATNATGEIRGIEAGTGITLTPNGSNYVIASTASGGGITTNANQFAASVELAIKSGANLTNILFWPTNLTGPAFIATASVGQGTNLVEFRDTNGIRSLAVSSNGMSVISYPLYHSNAIAFRTNNISLQLNQKQIFTNAIRTNLVLQITNALEGVTTTVTAYGAGRLGNGITNAWNILCTAASGTTIYWPPGTTNGNFDVLVNSNQVVVLTFVSDLGSTNVLASYLVREGIGSN